MSVYVGIQDRQIYIRNTNTNPVTYIVFSVEQIDALKDALDKAVKRNGVNFEWQVT